MKKVVILLIAGLVVALVCCGVGGFFIARFVGQVTASPAEFNRVQIGQTRDEVKEIMGSDGLASKDAEGPLAGAECRMWVGIAEGLTFEVCYLEDVVISKTEHEVGGEVAPSPSGT